MSDSDKSGDTPARDNRLKCSFCGKSQDMVKKLIAGPGVYICDECVELCLEILDDEDMGVKKSNDLANELSFQAELDDSFNSDEEFKELLEKVLEPLEKFNSRYQELRKVDCFEPGVRNLVVLKSFQKGKMSVELLPLLTNLGVLYRNKGELTAAKNAFSWALEICDADEDCDEKTKRYHALELAKLLMKTGEFKDGEELLDRIGYSS